MTFSGTARQIQKKWGGYMADRILVVDDDKDFRNEFRECFDEYEVIEASDGKEALALLKKPHSIDLVFLDVMLPGMKGTEVLRDIRKIEPDLNVVIITGYGSKDVAIQALRYHAQDFVEKPLNVERTKELIESILAAKTGEPELASCNTKDKIEKVKRFVERNCHKKVMLSNTASNVLCVSPKYLSRLFRKTTGMKFCEFKILHRIEKAKSLLTTTGYNVNQIAGKLGYQNSESFTRIFKKYTRCTPTYYRQKAAATQRAGRRR